MALLTLLLAMLAFQSETGLGTVIEILPVQRDKLEFRTAVFAMAARAIYLTDGTLVGPRVKACPGFHSALNLHVTFQAF